MTASTLSTPTPTSAKPASRRVTDAPTRVAHALFALSFAGAYLTAESERLRLVHVTLGYTLAGLLVFRLLYGLFGPRQARLTNWWTKLVNTKQWWKGVQAGWHQAPGAPRWTTLQRQAENLAMISVILGMVLSVVPLTLSGYATFNDWGGEWLEDLHELAGNFMLGLVLSHLGLLLLLSVLRRKNQALPMLTGRTEGVGPDLAKHNHAWLAVLILAVVLSYWSWEWSHAPAASDQGGWSSSHSHDEDD